MRYFAQILPPSDIASARALVSATAIPSPAEPFVPSPFKVTELISGINTAVGALCNMISKERLGRTQEIVVDAVNATASLTTHYSYQIDDMSSPVSGRA